jgi:hypothetical protein
MATIRFVCFLLCAYATAAMSAVSAADYRDWWYDPPQTRTDVSISQQGNRISGAWHLQTPDGIGAFLAFSGPIKSNVMTAPLFRHTGSMSACSDPAANDGTAMGTMTLTFTSDTTATFAYSIDGGAGTLNLVRYARAASRRWCRQWRVEVVRKHM